MRAHRARDFVINIGEGRECRPDPQLFGRLVDLLNKQGLDRGRPASLAQGLRIRQRVERKIGADGDRQHRSCGCACRQGLVERAAQQSGLIELVVEHRENVLIDKALPGQGAVKLKRQLVRRVCRHVRCNASQHGIAQIGQQPLETDVGHRIAFEQTAQQFVVAERRQSIGIEQFRQALRPGRIGAHDQVAYARIELDQADADAGKLARHGPRFDQGALHQPAVTAVAVASEFGKCHALREQNLAGRRFARFEPAARGAHRRLHVARRHIGIGQLFADAGAIGLQRQRPLEMRDGFARLALAGKRDAEPAMRLGVAWIERQNLAIMCNRRIPAPLLGEHIGEVESGCRGMRAQRERALVAGHGLGRPALLAAHIAEIEMRKRIIAADRDRALQMQGDIIEAAQRAVGQRDVVVIFRLVIAGGDRLRDQFRCRLGIALRQRDQSQIVQAVGMIWRKRQHVAVAPLGLGECAFLMKRHRCREKLGKRAAGCRIAGARQWRWRAGWNLPWVPVHCCRRRAL